MKVTDKMSRAVGQLEKMYNVLNLDLFAGELPTPIITVQSKPGSMGHSSVAKVWRKPNAQTYELNIAAEVLDYPIEETLDTIIHEMVHLYCREHQIKECSRGGAYHNKKFKAEAEKRGLTCIYTGEKYGWNTTPGDNLVEYALEKGWSEIRIGRGGSLQGIRIPGEKGTKEGEKQPTGGKRKSSTRKYICPTCGMSVRATKEVFIICGNCQERMFEG